MQETVAVDRPAASDLYGCKRHINRIAGRSLLDRPIHQPIPFIPSLFAPSPYQLSTSISVGSSTTRP